MHVSLPGTAPASDGTAHQAVDSVLHAMLSLGRLLRQRTTGDTFEPGSFWLLKSLADGSLRVTELATCSQLDSSTVSRHVAQLERAGLVERTPDPLDGRAQRVDLTGEGRSRLQDAMDRRREVLRRSLDGWDEQDLNDLDRLLARFVAGVEHHTSDREHA